MKLPSVKYLFALALGLTLGAAASAFAVEPSGAKTARATFAVPATMAPGIPTNLALTGAASIGTTLATPGVCVRISCSVDCQFRVTSGSSTAVATDNELPAAWPTPFCLLNNQDTITFFSAAAGTAKVAIVAGAAL